MLVDLSSMPEGHVIHRLANELNAAFSNRALELTSPQGRFSVETEKLQGAELTQAEAVGKHLFLHFDAPHDENIVHIHLGLIGTLRLEDPATAKGEIRLRIATDAIAAHLRGPQWCRLITEKDRLLVVNKLGADPLHPDADPERIKTKVVKSQRPIASLLMDQKLFAGVGNIYRAETLFRLGINPFALGKDIDNFDEIWQDLVALMHEGVAAGKIDTVRPEHTPAAMGREPRKDDHGGEVYVYRRAGQQCYICDTSIQEILFEGRNLFFCPSCQDTS